MYNRYIPQADGSFLKTRLEEPSGRVSPAIEDQAPPIFLHQSRPSPAFTGGAPVGIGQFFKNLVPGGLDTEDLIVILLLLLLSQNQGKEGKRAMLTLGAYLFL